MARLEKDTPFTYSFWYDSERFTFVFEINPACIEWFPKVNPENLALRYAKDRLGCTNIETDITKGFGVQGASLYKGIEDNKAILEFAIQSKATITEAVCTECEGTKNSKWAVDLRPCYHCRAIGFEIDFQNNLRDVAISLRTLFKYLNWFSIMNDEMDEKLRTCAYGRTQHIFIENEINTGHDGSMAGAGIGGYCSEEFLETMKTHARSMERKRSVQMFELEKYIESRALFPNINFYETESHFRCEVNEDGGFYIEVPGQNGCSFYTSGRGRGEKEITCHNVDRVHQQIGLLSGFGLLSKIFYEHQKTSPRG
jgi:hypothetical protein